jgi:hypothetical protein
LNRLNALNDFWNLFSFELELEPLTDRTLAATPGVLPEPRRSSNDDETVGKLARRNI